MNNTSVVNCNDHMYLEISARMENEGFARVVVGAFAARLDPTLEELNELRAAVSEAVMNCILHAYEGAEGKISIAVRIEDKILTMEIADQGKGIEDPALVRAPLYTDKPELERAGMGFTIMENFMDKLSVESKKGQGTRIIMSKTFGKTSDHNFEGDFLGK